MIQGKDVSRWHFWVSIVKSIFRGFAGWIIMQAGWAIEDTNIVRALEGNGGLYAASQLLILAGLTIIVAEVLGVVEELK